jgi:hypothetical protein
MQCKLCHREMTPADPVYRVLGRGPSVTAHTVSEICAKCWAATDWSWPFPRQWRSALCERCGRPVIYDRRQRLKHVVCSRECRLAVYRAIETAKCRSRVKPQPCALCGASFQPKRSDARYCSVACKQKAFRRRTVSAEAHPV